MTKLYILPITRCQDCPHFVYEESLAIKEVCRGCESPMTYIIPYDPNGIPDWCPLPDKPNNQELLF